MRPRPLPPYDRPGLRCFVHPEVHLHSQVGFKSLQHSVKLLGLAVVSSVVDADIMLYDPDQSDPTEEPLPAVQYGWVDHCIKAGKLLPFAAYAAASSEGQKAQIIDEKPRTSRVIGVEGSSREVIDLTQDSSDDEADRDPGLPAPPSNIAITPSGRVSSESNLKLIAWYKRYVEWALTLQPSRTGSRLSEDMAELVPSMYRTTFFNFVRRSDHHVAKYLRQRITDANNAPSAGPHSRSFNRRVTQLVEDFVARRVSHGNAAPKSTPAKPVSLARTVHKPENAVQAAAKSLAPDCATSDSDDSMAMFDRRPVKSARHRLGRNEASRHPPPRAATFRMPRPRLERPRVQAPRSGYISIEDSPSEDDCGYDRPAEVQAKSSPHVPSVSPRLETQETVEATSSENEEEAGTDTDASEHIMDFKRVKHTFRLHATPPPLPAERMPADTLLITSEEWDSWFLSYVDWVLQWNPQRDKPSVYAEMSNLTGNSRMAWKSVQMRLRDQVGAAFKRVRGKGRSFLSTSTPVKLEVEPPTSEAESDASFDVSDMQIRTDGEPRSDSDGQTSEKEDDDGMFPQCFEADHPQPDLHDRLSDGSGGTPMVKSPLNAREDSEKYDEGLATDWQAEQGQPGSSRLDDGLDTMAWLLHMTPRDKMFCVWQWLDMQFPGQNGGPEYWESLYRLVQTSVDARVQKIKDENDDC